MTQLPENVRSLRYIMECSILKSSTISNVVSLQMKHKFDLQVYLKYLKNHQNQLPWIATSTVFRANVIKIGISYLDNVGSKHCTSGNPW